MHYKTSKPLHILNAVTEFVVLLLAFVLAGFLRVVTPWGALFFFFDVKRYFPLALLYAGVMVAVYAFQGSYETIRIRGLVREGMRVGVSSLIGFALAATVLYVFSLSQFSRLLLAYFYVLSVVAIVIKRWIFQKIGSAYTRRHDVAPRILLVGGGALARRYYQDVIAKQKGVKYVGYLARCETPGLPDYLGPERSVAKVLAQHKVDRIVAAQDVQNTDQMRHLVALAESYHIRLSVVPIYSDFLYSHAEEASDSGLYTVDLHLSQTCEVMGVNIVVTSMIKTLALIESQLESWRGKYICVANVHTTVTAHEDASYQQIQNNAVMALPDGGPLSQYSRKQGFSEARRVTGPDLMKEILAISAEKGWRHYFYGSTQETLDLLRKKIEERYPGAIIAGMYSPPFRELTPQEDVEIVEQINAAKPDFVWVGLGAPKQERWMAAHEDRVKALMIGVGAAFDYEAGNIQRAPQWMQKHNLEWLYRLLQDPKRLFKRYFDTNLRYLWWTWRR